MPLHEKSVKGKVYVDLYISDNSMVGKPKAIDEVIEALQKHGIVLKIV